MRLLTQLENEQRMFAVGAARTAARMQDAEEKGRAGQNPYAKAVFSMFVLPLGEAITAALDMTGKGAGRHAAHIALLKPLDPKAVAYLSVNTALASLLGKQGGGLERYGECNVRTLSTAIGKSIYGELVIEQVAVDMPELHHSLMEELGRRRSKDERHRVTIMKHEAERRGLKLVEWPRGAREQVGMYLLELLEAAGMIEIEPQTFSAAKRKFNPQEVTMTAAVEEQIDGIRRYVSEHTPAWGPCVEPPRDWTSGVGGGFHTRKLQALHPTLVRGASEVRSLCRGAVMPSVLAAANALQRTPWRVNKRILATIRAVGGGFSLKEVVSADSLPRPERPAFLDLIDKANHTDEQAVEFTRWKHSVAEWHTRRRLLRTKVGRLTCALEGAEEFSHYPAIYFAYFADSRGRLYPMTYGLNPQGSDMQKALLEFPDGMPVETPDAIRWFLINGANRYGFDKARLEDRAKWVTARQDLLLSFADDPVNNSEWRDASKPLQFLAWCFEYADWVRDNTGAFRTHLPVAQDGSCNGLQNLSAMMRDEVGGAATNLIPSDDMRDIYADVAVAATHRMRIAVEEDLIDESLRQRWLAHGINRDVCKRSVMTTPYGVTLQSAAKYVIADYLKEGKAGNTFNAKEYRRAAQVLMRYVWPAIGDIVVKGREAMAWLKKAAPKILKARNPEAPPIIDWVSPSGFHACQEYFEEAVHRINTRLHGPVKIRMVAETEDPDKSRHGNGMAPNFVHSMDAAHLHLTAEAAAAAGIKHLAMIHDDYGTHATNSEALYHIIRQQFVRMYEEHDPVADFFTRYPEAGDPPSKGTLDIRGVLASKFFFS